MINVDLLGFIGVGQMGLPMASNLLAAGLKLVVFDANPKALEAIEALGAIIVDTPKAVGDQCEVVFVSLPTPAVVEAVAIGPGGIVEGEKVKAYVDLSTTGSVVACRVANGLAERGVAALDCPVSGGERGAIKGSLALMAAGPKDLYDTLQPVLAHIGSQQFFVGESVGAGQTLKLCNNFLSAANNVAASEAMVAAVKGGLDAKVALDVINASSGRNSATADKFEELVLTGAFTKSMKTRLLLKDLTLFTAEAEAMGVPAWMGSYVRQLLAYSVSQGMGDEPSVTMIKHWERWAGVEVREAGAPT
jgi:3-hydroxyisobutyrate dehydrogenase-like beta-hydroxyacid dehydrogenase